MVEDRPAQGRAGLGARQFIDPNTKTVKATRLNLRSAPGELQRVGHLAKALRSRTSKSKANGSG